jgi:hypothetical protein
MRAEEVAGLAPWTGFLGFASGSLGSALPANGWIAFQIRATAFLRSENFFTSRLPGTPSSSTGRLEPLKSEPDQLRDEVPKPLPRMETKPDEAMAG